MGTKALTAKALTVKALTAKERRQLDAASRKWRKRIQPMLDAIEASTRITGADLAIRIGPAPRKDLR